jgi:hypothetical protein
MAAALSNHWEISNDDLTADHDFASASVEFEAYDGLSFEYQVQLVADRIFTIHQDRGVKGEFIFGFDCNSEGEISSGTVAIACTGEFSMYLMHNIDLKHLTDNREATGWDQAAAIRDALMNGYEMVRALAVKKELI